MSRTFGNGILRAIVLFAALGAYFLGSGNAVLIHPFVHDHASVSHTPDDEANACHRVVHHDDSATDCEHGAHVVTAQKCQLCDIILKHDEATVGRADAILTYFDTHHFPEFRSNPSAAEDGYYPSRAPPAA